MLYRVAKWLHEEGNRLTKDVREISDEGNEARPCKVYE
jgi:hypothetical protein